jgi:hypothetical protein
MCSIQESVLVKVGESLSMDAEEFVEVTHLDAQEESNEEKLEPPREDQLPSLSTEESTESSAPVIDDDDAIFE